MTGHQPCQVLEHLQTEKVEVGIVLIVLPYALFQLAQVFVNVTAELDAVQAGYSGTCLKGDFLAIDLDFLCNCHNRNPPKFHVKLAEPKPCHISCFLLCRVNAHQCITATHSRQLSIPLLDLLVIDQRIGQAFCQFAVCLCLCICGNGSLLGFCLCIGDRHLLIGFCLGNGGFVLDLLLICVLLCNGLLLDGFVIGILEIHVVDDDLVYEHNILTIFLHKGLCQLLLCQRLDLGTVGYLIGTKFCHRRLDCRCHQLITDQILDVGHIRIQPCALFRKHLIGHDDISSIHRGLVRGFAPDLCFDVLILLLVVDLVNSFS
nr:MAG TPA: hypothetical protein [Caudoviricetes sp.]